MAIYRFDIRSSTNFNTKATDHADYVIRIGKYQPNKTYSESHSEYVTRTGAFAHRKGYEDLLYSESVNLPKFAKEDPKVFWKASEKYERKNGVTYKEFEFALPKELNDQQNIELAKTFCNEIFGTKYVYTLGIHKKKCSDEDTYNTHVHVMFSERELDKIERNEKQFFKRYNKNNPEKGGALKSKQFNKLGSIKDLRKKWEKILNSNLEKNNIEKVSSDKLVKQREYAIKEGNYLKAEYLDRIPINLNGSTMIKIKNKGEKALSDYEKKEFEKYQYAKELKERKERIYKQSKHTKEDIKKGPQVKDEIENEVVEKFIKSKIEEYQTKISKTKDNESEKYIDVLLKIREEYSHFIENSGKYDYKNSSYDKNNNDVIEETHELKQHSFIKNIEEIEAILEDKKSLKEIKKLDSKEKLTNEEYIVKLDTEINKELQYNFYKKEIEKTKEKLQDKNLERIAINNLKPKEKEYYNKFNSNKKEYTKEELELKNKILSKVIASKEKIKATYTKKLNMLEKMKEKYSDFKTTDEVTEKIGIKSQEEVKELTKMLGNLNKKYEDKINNAEKNIKALEKIIVNTKSYEEIQNEKTGEKEKNKSSPEQEKKIKETKFEQDLRKNKISNMIQSLKNTIEITKEKRSKVDNVTEKVQFNQEERFMIKSVETQSMFEYLQDLEDRTREIRGNNEKLKEIAKTKIPDEYKENKELYDTKVSQEIIKLKEYYDKRIETLEYVKKDYSEWEDITEQAKKMSNNEKVEFFNKYYEIKSNSMKSDWEKINKLEKELIKTKEDKNINLVIKSVKDSINRSKEYAINIDTKGEYFKLNKKILITQNDKTLKSNEKNKILEDLKKQKESYEKLNVKETEKKVITNLEKVLEKYEKPKKQKIAEANKELRSLYQSVKVSSISIKNLRKELDLKYEIEKQKRSVPLNNASKIYSGLGKVEKRNKRGDGLTELIKDRIDGFEND